MLRFLIADDHAIVTEGIKQLLLQEYPSALIENVADAESLIKKIREKDWDMVISDFNMPGKTGIDALIEIKQSNPKLPVMIMSMHEEKQFGMRAIKAGASAYLGKNTMHEDLIKAIKMVLQGRKYITPAIAEQMADSLNDDTTAELHEHLSRRELDVFRMLAEGKSTTEIAKLLKLSPTTISTFRSRIMEKMKMKSNAELARYAYEKKML